MMENKTEFNRLQKKIQRLEKDNMKYKTAYSVLAFAQEHENFKSIAVEAGTLPELNHKITQLEKKGFSAAEIHESRNEFFQNYIAILRRRF